MRTRRLSFTVPLAVSLIAATLHAQVADSSVATAIGRTHIDPLTTFVAGLSRVTSLYLRQNLLSYGLAAQLQDFGTGGNNVYAVQKGVERPGTTSSGHSPF